MGRKIKKVIMIAAFGMVTGGQIADLLDVYKRQDH